MKKRSSLILIMILVLTISLLFAFAGCDLGFGDGNSSNNNNTDNNQQIDPDNSNTNNGGGSNNNNPSNGMSGDQVYNMVKDAVVEIHTYNKNGGGIAQGSGFFVSSTEICTNYHVIEDAYYIEVVMANNTKTRDLKVIGYSKDKDLASLKLNTVKSNKYLAMDTGKHVVGEVVYTMGSSVGLTGTFSDGIISTEERIVQGKKCYQITAPISHGNSGGPLISKDGKALGVNSMSRVDGQNLNFSIKIIEYKNLPKTKNMTSVQFYNATHGSTPGTNPNPNPNPNPKPGGGGSGSTIPGVGDKVVSEREPNSSLNNAQYMSNGTTMVGSVDGTYDLLDYFAISMSAGDEIGIIMEPKDKVDKQYMMIGLLDQAGDVIAASTYVRSEDLLGLVHTVNRSGRYYIVVLRSDKCPWPSLDTDYVMYTKWI